MNRKYHIGLGKRKETLVIEARRDIDYLSRRGMRMARNECHKCAYYDARTSDSGVCARYDEYVADKDNCAKYAAREE